MPLRNVAVVCLGLLTSLGCMRFHREEASKAEREERSAALQQAIGEMALERTGGSQQKVMLTPEQRMIAQRTGVMMGSVQAGRSAPYQVPASRYLGGVSVTKQGGIWRAKVQATREWDGLRKDEKVQLMKDLWSAWSQASGDGQAAIEVFNGLTSLAHADTNKPKYTPDGAVGDAFITVELNLKPGNRMGP